MVQAMDQLANEGVLDVNAMELGAIEGALDSASNGSVNKSGNDG